MLLDGNHRVYSATKKKCRTVSTKILETDQEVQESKAISLIGLMSIEEVISKYNQIWKPCCEARGIRIIGDYKVNPPLSLL